MINDPDDPRHGSKAGYEAHKQGGPWPPCEPCMEAGRAYMRGLRNNNPERRALDNWYSRTYARAQRALAGRYPGEFYRILAGIRRDDPPPRGGAGQ